MSTLRGKEATAQAGPTAAPPGYVEAREKLAARFLRGEGLEIGPLHQPLEAPPQARVRYVDRMSADELRREYPELADWDLTPVDVIDDGEQLNSIPDASQSFIVANHFIEHCENPIGTIEVHLRKLKPGGVLFYAVPDKRYTFDFRRPATPIEHMVADYEEGPERSRAQHYEEWASLVSPEEGESEEQMLARAREIERIRYSIHMHAWTQAEFLGLILACRDRFDEDFDIEAAARQGIEFIVVLRKRGPVPQDEDAGPGRALRLPAKLGRRVRGRLRRAKG